VKLAVVVQRYGADINGGAELHARYVAEHLARHHEVEVLTTCARDYVSWRNELPAGEDTVNGVHVRRFPVDHERDPERFGRLSEAVFAKTHSVNDELAWLEAEGPASRGLVAHAASRASAYDFAFFFSARYHHAWHGARAMADRAILVPTAEREPAIGVSIFGAVFRGVRALMYNSFEERAMIHAIAGNRDVPGVVVGVGSDVPSHPDAGRARRKFSLPPRYVVYVGRIDENKGCKELFAFFERYASARGRDLALVLVGNSILPIPDHPRIRHLGFLDDRDKFDVIAGSVALVMPSYFESLSMVALEAWALGRPVLANGRCDVLRGQCARSNAGLYYENFEEFTETLYAIDANPHFTHALGHNGREYFRRHYSWPVIEQKYLDMLNQLVEQDRQGRTRPPLEPLPGFFARRRRVVPPAAEILTSIPAGPVLPARPGVGRRHHHQAPRTT
jgi:glycosyltransferase involved in cell wall biosynthesis